MKEYAIFSYEKGKVGLKEIHVPDPKPDEVQVQVHLSLISPGTERAYILDLPNTFIKYPVKLGYSAAGVVKKVGSEVKELSVGDRVYCRLAHQSLGNMNASSVFKLPDEVSLEHAAFTTLGHIALQGVRKTRLEIGEAAMVIGLGVIGQISLQLARIGGALPAIGVDRIQSRLNTALQCGADKVFNADEENWMEAVGDKPQVVIELTGAPDAVGTALEIVRPFGRVSLTGSSRGLSTVNFYRDVHSKGVTIIGAHASSGVPKYESYPGYWTIKDNNMCILELIRRGRLNLDPLITDRVNWQDIEPAYQKMLEYSADMIGCIIQWV